MNDIPLADILAFGVIAACIVMSMIRGVIAEAGSLFAWVISFLLAKTFAVPFSEVAFKSIQPRALGVAISFVVIFFFGAFFTAVFAHHTDQCSVIDGLGQRQQSIGRRVRRSQRRVAGHFGGHGLRPHRFAGNGRLAKLVQHSLFPIIV